MIKIFLIISSLFLLNIRIKSQTYNLFYLNDSVVEKIGSDYYLKNNLSSGRWNIYWDKNLNLLMISGEIKNGMLENKYISYYRNQQPKYECFYVNNIKNGPVLEYDSLGNKMVEQIVKNDIPTYDSTCRVNRWDENHNLIGKMYFEKSINKCKVERFNSLGMKIEENILSKDGQVLAKKHWCDNGILKYEWENRTDTKQEFRTYYCNGNIESISYFVDNHYFKVSKYIEYFENGNIKIIGNYTDSLIDIYGNSKVGEWKYFSEDGKLIKTESYPPPKCRITK